MKKIVQFFTVSLKYITFVSVQYKVKATQLCSTLCDPMGGSQVRLLCLWNSTGKNTAMGCHSLRLGIFPTQGSNPGLLYCRQILYCPSHQKSQREINKIIF